MHPLVRRAWNFRLGSARLAIIVLVVLFNLSVFPPAAHVARAEADAFGLGNGQTGALAVTLPNTIVNSYAQVAAPIAPGDISISVSTTAGFAAGDLVLVLQTTGIVPAPLSGAAGPFDLSGDPVGRWEPARLASVG